MQIIYKPRGKAREYAELALNLRKSCEHACKYCFCPQTLHMPKEDFFQPGDPVPNLFNRLGHDLRILSEREDCPEVLISFIADPYQPCEMDRPIMPTVIDLFNQYKIPFTILTKGGTRVVRDLHLLLQAGDRFRLGTSISFYHDWIARRWEPFAASIPDRYEMIRMAKNNGIKTWVSLEPVIDPDEAMQILAYCYQIVDEFKVGKINYMPEIEAQTDWRLFRDHIIQFMDRFKVNYYLKDSLREL